MEETEFKLIGQRIINILTAVSRHSTAQHSTAQHSTAQHRTAQHSPAVTQFFDRYQIFEHF